LSEAGAILTGEDIKARLDEADPSRKIFITPILSEKQIGRASIDVRLGNVFIVFRRTKYSGLDVLETSKEKLASRIEEFQERIYVPLGKKFFLHPQQLVLGCTLEYVRIPNDLVAEVVGRSSWGRLGLILSAATLVHPGFAGVITLELATQCCNSCTPRIRRRYHIRTGKPRRCTYSIDSWSQNRAACF